MSGFRTRVIALATPSAREVAANRRTIGVAVRPPRAEHDPRGLFRAHHARIRATCLDFAEPGVALFAFDRATGAWSGSVCLAARPGEPRAAVVGRHSEADLHLGDDPGLALRHLMVVVEPPTLAEALAGAVRYRVLDLTTGCPPVDEAGRSLEAIVAEGSIFLTCRGVALFAVVTGPAATWTAAPDAEAAWAALPARVPIEERIAAGSAAGPLPAAPPAPAPAGPAITLVRAVHAPRAVTAHVDDDDPIHALLALRSGERQTFLRLGREALRRGLLVGRYDRCSVSQAFALNDPLVSRVHLLLLQVGDTTYAIDVASTNGVHRPPTVDVPEPPHLPLTALADGDVLMLSATTGIAWGRP